MPYKKKENKFWGKKKPNHIKSKPNRTKNIIEELSTQDEAKSSKVNNPDSIIGDAVVVNKEISKKPKYLSIFGIVITILALVASGVFAFFLLKDDTTEKPVSAGGTARITIPAGYFEQPKVEYTYLKSMKAIKLVPKTDFLANADATKEAVSAEVDAIIKNLQTLQFNSIVVDTKLDQKVIYDSSIFEKTSVDALSILIEKAKAANISVVAVYHLNNVKTADGTAINTHLSYTNKAYLYDGVAELVGKYELDSILLDDYYVSKDANAYEQFMAHGAVGKYEDWLLQNTSVTIDGAVEAIHTAKSGVPTGLLIKDVWANDAQNKLGSKTKAEYTTLINGFADTKGMVESKSIDFVNVEIPTILESATAPFINVGSWWSTVCKTANMPLYITHNVANANVAGAGTDQLALQVSKSIKLPGYHGSTFTNIKTMMDNMSENKSTDILLKYYADNYSETDLNQGLEISSPKKKQFTTYEESVQFRGKFDPNQEVFLNGKKVEPSSRGGFSVWVDLNVGKNNIVLEHKGKKTTFVVERKVDIIKEWSPTKDIKVSGSSQIEFEVTAYRGSKITATINGKTIALQETERGDQSQLDSNYVYFTGSYTAPRATAKDQNIGRISFNGSYQGYNEKQSGSNVIVNKIPDEVDPDGATGQVLQHAIINRTYAYTYPYNTMPSYPAGVLYQLPHGTQDIVQSINGDFVNLRSGKTVKMSDVTLSDIPFVGNNSISEFKAGTEGDDTVIRATMGWKAPFSIMPSPYPDQGSNGYRFDANTITILFDYTTTYAKDNFIADMSSSPIFSGISVERVKNQERNIWQYKVTLPLRQAGRYYGAHAQYEGNTLVIRFNHPPQSGSLSGLNIVVDVGHGGSDNGTMAGRDVLEKDINLVLAEKLRSELEAYGANVIMTRTDDTTIVPTARVDLFNSYHQADLLISVHHNSAGSNQQPHGVETYFNTPFSQPLAASVQAQLGQHMTSRGSKYYNFYQLRQKQFPSILIEYAFLSNPSDEALALDPAHQDAMAKATAQGVVDYFN